MRLRPGAEAQVPPPPHRVAPLLAGPAPSADWVRRTCGAYPPVPAATWPQPPGSAYKPRPSLAAPHSVPDVDERMRTTLASLTPLDITTPTQHCDDWTVTTSEPVIDYVDSRLQTFYSVIVNKCKMLVEDSQTTRALMTKKYAHCPLKKRPVLVREERPATPPTTPPHPAHLATRLYYDYNCDTANDEPENLSTKPEDLSKTGNYPSKASSPVAAAAVKVEPHEWPQQQLEYLAACRARLEPVPTEVARPTPQYAYLPTLYANYPLEELYPAAPALSPPAHSQLYAHYSPASPPSSCSPPPCPEDLRSPGSVSSDSGVSVSAPRRPRYQCPDCAKSYSTYSGLSKHQQYHCAAAEGSLARKSFSCKFCAKIYTSLGALKMHIRTHTLPCKCHLCGKAFSRPWLLQGHIRTHTGEKPFSCHHCRRAFADRSNLRAHLQTHSDVKKYSCSGCGKTFSRMSLLSKHLEGGCGAPGASPYEFRPEHAHQALPPSATVHAY